jgi:NitT/TauT family transport system substrate-binding protein
MSSRLTKIPIRCMTVATVLAWSVDARALDHLTVQLAFYPQGPQAYVFVAKEKGWYEKAGLDVEVLEGRGSSYSMQVLSGGHADIGEGQLLPLVFARARGAAVKIVAEWYAKDGLAIVVPTDSPIREPRDLRGQKLVLTAAGPWPPLLDPFLKQFGMTQQDVSLVYVNSSALFTSYASGQGDALMTVDLAFTEANPMRASRLMTMTDYGVKVPGNGLYVTEDALAKKRDALARFVKVSAEAMAYVYDGHAEEARVAILKQSPGLKLSPAVLDDQIAMFAALRFLPSTEGKPVGWQSPEEWDSRVAYLTSAHLLTGAHQPTEFYTNELLGDGAK